ncbi:MAG: nickel pincer cofactor biosynthesis protein LarC [Desulfobacteraceae bacterium]|nr:nickel pincer cofactor biosynthesis protein LarC [Desulfobacteraceae bacterium]
MNILYLDCQSGISGDMAVGALLDLGVPLELLRAELTKLGLSSDSYALSTHRTERQHVAALKFDVQVNDHHTHRHYAGIDAMIAGSALADPVKETSRRIFRRLAEAEAKVHGVAVEDVHFHEVGAVDSIVDIVGTVICLEYLGVEAVYAAALPLGSGFIETAHGRLPVPAPATAELLRGMPVHGGCGEGERVTPTGAAILVALATSPGTRPDMTLLRVGNGAGGKDFSDCPNILRAFLGTDSGGGTEEAREVSCNLDDVTAEVIGYVQELLLERGALDVWLVPVQMKKGRPGVVLTFLCLPTDLERLAALVMSETGTLGVRYTSLRRIVQSRRIEERDTQFGRVRFKVSEFGEKPEYEDCRRIARERGIPCRVVMQRLLRKEEP